MRFRRIGTTSAIAVALALAPTLGASAASAAEGSAAASEDDCGFSTWNQSYKNCTAARQNVQFIYSMAGPGGAGVLYPKATYCIQPGETKNVGRPDGLYAGQATVLKNEPC